MLAKNVVTVDHISNGRAELGIGAGWYEAEHETYGFPFGTTRERLDELDRGRAEFRRQLAEAGGGGAHRVERPRPPRIVGGRAKPRTVQAAVRFADEYNTVFPSVDEARDRCRILADAAREAGRKPLRFSMMIGCVVGRDRADTDERIAAWRALTGQDGSPGIAGTVDEVVAQLRAYEAAGVERTMLQHLVHEDVEMVAVLGEVAAALSV